MKGRRFRYVAFRLEAGPGAAVEGAPDGGAGGHGGTSDGGTSDGGTGARGDGGTGPVTFRDLVGELRRMDDGDDVWLIEFDGTHGIVRCPHTAKEATIALLAGMDRVGDVPVDVETLGTSGTIRRCRAKFLP